ncbi:MAG: hypothetical protein JWP97_5764 [Labilithrix sp.]|nr:hypothetical protein [Labilithrix sp.]
MPAEITLESGFSVFVDRMRAYLEAHAVPAEFAAGWLARPKQATRPGGNRIVIGPSDKGGRGGQIIPAMGPGVRMTATQAWRPLAAWEMQLACYVWATDKTSEEAQVNASFGLMQWAMRAIADASYGHFTFGATDWTTPETLTQYGREMKLSFLIRTHVIDLPWDLTGPLVPVVKREGDP